MTDQTVVITGGAGYVGFSLVRALANHDGIGRILVLDNLARRNHALFVSGAHGPVPVEFRQVDILDGTSLDQAMQGADIVYHLAAHATTPQADIENHVFDQVNNWGTSQVARSVEASSTVKTLIYLSSFAVYGNSADAIDENTVTYPVAPYAISKLAGEAHMQRLDRDGRRVVIVRAGNVFGFNPAIRFDAVINALCFHACTQGQVQIHGDGEQTRPFIDVGDLSLALTQLLEPTISSGIYNLATHNASVNDIVEIVADLVPDLDRMQINRDLRMQNVEMVLPVALSALLDLPDRSLEPSIADLITRLKGQPIST